jgi:two-component system, chemotaxis family, protein-glutamate methylesterase/glutaminase
MPHMDGLTFLRKIMTLRPMPVVMFSTLTQAGAEATLEALEIGAVDFVTKPSTEVASAMTDLAEVLQAKVKAAARTRLRARRAPSSTVVRERPKLGRITGRIVVIGASTGGVEALKGLLMGMPSDCPPTLITQHMPERFTNAFAQRLDRECPMTVSEATHNERIEPGHVYIAPGGAHHLELVRANGHYMCSLVDMPPVSGHRPSVDVLFRSAARVAGRTAIGVILTGMGKDGADGMLEMRQAGATTFGQDEQSSLIYGMPRVAFENGAVMQQLPLLKLADAIVEACGGEGGAMGPLRQAASRTAHAG